MCFFHEDGGGALAAGGVGMHETGVRGRDFAAGEGTLAEADEGSHPIEGTVAFEAVVVPFAESEFDEVRAGLSREGQAGVVSVFGEEDGDRLGEVGRRVDFPGAGLEEWQQGGKGRGKEVVMGWGLLG